MNKKIVVMILMAFLVVACGKRDPEYVGLYNMKIHEMFPQDAQLRALAKAASKGDIQSIDKLVAQGVDVNAVGHRGYTAAMWALYHPNKAGFKRLLEHGTNPNYIMKPSFAKKIRETSLIHETTSRTYSMGVGYLEMILDIGNGDPNLQLPTSKSRPISKATSSTLSQKQAFVLLYNAGAEIDYSDKYDALINSACHSTNYELAFFLLEQGVDYTRGAPYDWAKDYAEKYENIELISRTWAAFQVGLSYHADRMWFWRCIDFLENKGVNFVISPEIEKLRPAVLSTNPTLYELEIEKQKKQRGDINES